MDKKWFEDRVKNEIPSVNVGTKGHIDHGVDLVREGREKLRYAIGGDWKFTAYSDDEREEHHCSVGSIYVWGAMHLLDFRFDQGIDFEELKATADFLAWSRNNMAALLDQIEQKDKQLDRQEAAMLIMKDHDSHLRAKVNKLQQKITKRNKLMDELVESNYKTVSRNQLLEKVNGWLVKAIGLTSDYLKKEYKDVDGVAECQRVIKKYEVK